MVDAFIQFAFDPVIEVELSLPESGKRGEQRCRQQHPSGFHGAILRMFCAGGGRYIDLGHAPRRRCLPESPVHWIK
jgi:hypothetical protein